MNETKLKAVKREITKTEKMKIIIKKLIEAQTLKELLKCRDMALELK